MSTAVSVPEHSSIEEASPDKANEGGVQVVVEETRNAEPKIGYPPPSLDERGQQVSQSSQGLNRSTEHIENVEAKTADHSENIEVNDEQYICASDYRATIGIALTVSLASSDSSSETQQSTPLGS